MRVADYIFKYLADYGVEHVFLVTGGGAMHLNDALNKEKRLKYICNHHEQASAIAAEGYARTSGELAVVNVTSGPGGTNAMTGVIGQWLDSVPVLYLSGQVKYETCIPSAGCDNLRQLGDQEINIVDIVKPVTKYAKMVIDPKEIKAELEKAIHIATTGRPGPVWLDIPLNVQAALVEENELSGADIKPLSMEPDAGVMEKVVEKLQKAERPVIIAGHGIRIGKAEKEFLKLVDSLGIPVVTTFNGFDLIASDSDKFIGRIGTLGSRAGNFAVQNADVILSIGSRNNIRQVSYNWEAFGRHAEKIIVDIDNAELNKKTVKPDIAVLADTKCFIEALLKMAGADCAAEKSWLDWCLERKRKYPVVLDEYRLPKPATVHPYHFIESLTARMDKDGIAVAGNGTACVALFHAGEIKQGQRVFWNSGCASMGYGLPAAIGAAVAVGRDIICITGDGSIQMNLQELQTIKQCNLPVKIFLLNNNGYSSIKQTQNSFFNGNLIGCDPGSGVSFPDADKLAALYGFKYHKIDSVSDMEDIINRTLGESGPVICEVVLTDDYIFAPKLSSKKLEDGTMISKPLEDLFPFLDREEFKSNMLVPIVEE